MAKKIAVLSIKEDTLDKLEGETAQRVMMHLLAQGKGKPFDVFEFDGDNSLTVKDIHAYGRYDFYLLINGIVFITRESINTLSEIMVKNKTFSALAPVSNESKVAHQKRVPSFLYQTVSVFRWAAEEIYRAYREEVTSVDKIDDFCFAFRRELLNSLPADYKIINLPDMIKKNGLRFGIAKGVYAHRYGNCYESSRDDLIRHVPLDARKVLDVGSARGLFGETLKKRQICSVTGVEIDNEMIAVAASRLDDVIHGDIEDIIEKKIPGEYDCIVCGDVLEHLNNPWKVVKGLKSHLRKGGLFIASTPNIMNWSIIFDLLNGRWDYVPFSILSGTHIRFFTVNSLKELFEGAGYKVKEMLFQSFEIPPQGLRFIATLKNIQNGINEEELKASEIVVVAEK